MIFFFLPLEHSGKPPLEMEVILKYLLVSHLLMACLPERFFNTSYLGVLSGPAIWAKLMLRPLELMCIYLCFTHLVFCFIARYMLKPTGSPPSFPALFAIALLCR